jgi:hypothetical protein
MTYDEVQWAALVGVSSPTVFVNRGHRTNCGKPSECIASGIYIALVGARYERMGEMEHQYTIVSK